MPKRDDIKKILVIGSGPIVIGQACEFDYSGSQACQVLKSEGYRVILVNSNPATIMTDPTMADATYVEPLTKEILEKIIEKELPDAILPTLGGQTALNLAMELYESKVLDLYNVELIGASRDSIMCAENRELFKVAMQEIGLKVAESSISHSIDDALEKAREIGYPVIVRPSFILGGHGTGIAANEDEFNKLAQEGLDASPSTEILIEKSIAGWKEYELEVMRDNADNCVVICSIENVDPMGIHTGDSITVAPAQTLSDVEYQKMRDAAFRCIRRVGVETGGSNIQFAVNPIDGEMVVIEMNPRVSRSSALASKATGFPIAKIAAKLAVGYRLDEIVNDITKVTPASFEPTIDYVVTKIPRWAFEKLPGAENILSTRMQSVGEVMAIGSTFAQSLQKAVRSLEQGRYGLNADEKEKLLDNLSVGAALQLASRPTPERIFLVEYLLRNNVSVDDVFEKTRIDPWFLDQIKRISDYRTHVLVGSIESKSKGELKKAKQLGFSNEQLAYLFNISTEKVAKVIEAHEIFATFKTVDTCAGEFEAFTPYHYSTYDDCSEVRESSKQKVMILGSGPNRIGQGIEFDYCCVHASIALREAGYETIMVNCNPETVSTDYDTSDRLYFEPLTSEDLNNIIRVEKESCIKDGKLLGIIVGLGGQTPLKLASHIGEDMILGTSAKSIDLAEDRDSWNRLLEDLNVKQALGGTALDLQTAKMIASQIGFPVLIRPSYVLGGRAMEIVYDHESLDEAWLAIEENGSLGKEGGLSSQRSILIDRFLEDAIELDVDALRDSTGDIIIGGIMEHVEEAGIHSGDSACVIPPISISPEKIAEIEIIVKKLANALNVIGPINVQFALKDESIFVIEANPRASRTLPFLSKATGVPLAKAAARLMVGDTLESLVSCGLLEKRLATSASGIVNYGSKMTYFAVKEAVLPFTRFPQVDSLLGPEMRSTGEVMGLDINFPLAFEKSQSAAGSPLPESGTIFLSLADRDKKLGIEIARDFFELGFRFVATSGTAKALRENGVDVLEVVAKRTNDSQLNLEYSSQEPLDAVEIISSGKVDLIINTPRGRGARADGDYIRRASSKNGISCITTLQAAAAAGKAIRARRSNVLVVRALQEL